MNIPLYQVDTFTSVVFKGNPAAVCVLDKWLSEGLMQEIAAENNLSETAFVVKKDNLYELKWFTPLSEVDLCGHATLAAAFILFRFYDTEASRIEFETKSGAIFVEKSGPLLSLFFPERRGEAAFTVEGLPRALGNAEPEKILLARDYLVIYSDEAIVRSLTPQMDLLKKVPVMGVIASAPGKTADFVYRYFAPAVGIPEDPVTGSAQCTLIPYWSERLRKKKLHSVQVSRRGGDLFCEQLEGQVKISGEAALFMHGKIQV